MRGSLNSAVEGCKTIDQIIHQEVSEIEQKVKELQVTVGNLMIVIVDHVTFKEEGSKEKVLKTSEGIEQDIKELLRCGLRIVPVVSYSF
jgi:archaellum component FlaC